MADLKAKTCRKIPTPTAFGSNFLILHGGHSMSSDASLDMTHLRI